MMAMHRNLPLVCLPSFCKQICFSPSGIADERWKRCVPSIPSSSRQLLSVILLTLPRLFSIFWRRRGWRREIVR